MCTLQKIIIKKNESVKWNLEVTGKRKQTLHLGITARLDFSGSMLFMQRTEGAEEPNCVFFWNKSIPGREDSSAQFLMEEISRRFQGLQGPLSYEQRHKERREKEDLWEVTGAQGWGQDEAREEVIFQHKIKKLQTALKMIILYGNIF